MKTLDLKRYLRQQKSRKNGEPGSYSIRFLWVYSKKQKAKRIERGLGTNNEAEAIARAAILLRFIYSLGYRISNRLQVMRADKSALPLRKIHLGFADLPLFANFSPFPEVDKEEKQA